MAAFFDEKKIKTSEALVNGVDFDFQDASLQTLNQIAYVVGGVSRFNLSDQRVTYMFKSTYVVPIESLSFVHKKLDVIGEQIGHIYSCRYIGNELYLKTDKAGAVKISQFGVDFYLRHI
jgi:hypothetical protein